MILKTIAAAALLAAPAGAWPQVENDVRSAAGVMSYSYGGRSGRARIALALELSESPRQDFRCAAEIEDPYEDPRNVLAGSIDVPSLGRLLLTVNGETRSIPLRASVRRSLPQEDPAVRAACSFDGVASLRVSDASSTDESYDFPIAGTEDTLVVSLHDARVQGYVMENSIVDLGDFTTEVRVQVVRRPDYDDVGGYTSTLSETVRQPLVLSPNESGERF